jgi:diguanylate cyclase (GGDEF)-like protein
MDQVQARLAALKSGRGQAVAVMMCDLDHFKRINDRWGHAAGDRVLQAFGEILRAQLRPTDFAGRIGGEEFAVLLDVGSLQSAVAVAHRLQAGVSERPHFEDGQEVALTLSIGVSLMTAADASPEAAISRSDKALYRAKEEGRNRVGWMESGA